MPHLCFDGYYRTKAKDNENKNDDIDIYDMIASALVSGISYQALGNMSFVMLNNIVDALAAPKKHKPTQEEIDLIT